MAFRRRRRSFRRRGFRGRRSYGMRSFRRMRRSSRNRRPKRIGDRF